jgi:DNA-binding transcriptional ArsR family regulator
MISAPGFLRALANEKRLLILEWLLSPTANFPPQVDGDLVEDGVCLGAIVRKLGVSQPTGTAHMKILTEAGLVEAKQIKTWVFFRPHRKAIGEALEDLQSRLAGSRTTPRPGDAVHVPATAGDGVGAIPDRVADSNGHSQDR